MGEKMGDKAITVLSELMRKYLPKDTYFARLDDANLLAICPKTDLNEMRESLKKNKDGVFIFVRVRNEA